jgi:polyphosphate kinase
MKTLASKKDSRFFSRELSWMAFNDRVLEEAADISNPLLERLKYLSIVSGNLEEFFMVRVAQLKRIQASPAGKQFVRDGFTVDALLNRIRNWAKDQKDRQATVFADLKVALAREGLVIEDQPSALAQEVFEDKVSPFLTPIKVPEHDKLPLVQGRRIYLLARHGSSYSLIPMPVELPRLFIVKTKHVFLVDRLISMYKHLVFKNINVEEIFSFKVSRDAEIALDEEAEDLLKEVEEALADRNVAPIVRVEVDAPMMSTGVLWLQKQLAVPANRFIQISLPLDLKSLGLIYNIKKFKKLKFQFSNSMRPKNFPTGLSTAKFFRILDKNDVLLHHPFQSFDPVVELVQKAAEDPKTTRICQTLYRTSKGSPVLQALTHAAKIGKRVTVLVEIKARFDEANNIRWARELEKAGATVVYGTPEIKVHAKLTYVERKIGSKTRSYVHMSTGNYHPQTAKLYTDIGLLTTQPEYATDARRLFDLMEDMESKGDYSLLNHPRQFSEEFKTWVVAPSRLQEKIIDWIDREAEHARAGQPSGIRAKMNGLVEHSVIDALYRASQAGVPIKLLVRGICCLRPGVKGLSENIEVKSIVDKYLEHSRFFIFEHGGDRRLYMSSADWMPRNFFRRIELAVPLRKSKLQDYITETIWNLYERDNTRARVCNPDGLYTRVTAAPGDKPCRAQFEFEKLDVPLFTTAVSGSEAPLKPTQGASRESPLTKASLPQT